MIKKLFYLIVLGLIGYIIFMPMAIEQNNEKTSIFDLLEANNNEKSQDDTTDDES